MYVTEETKQLAQDILDYWDATGMHDQGSWTGNEFAENVTVDIKNINGKQMPVCNTTMCAAGTAVFLNTRPERWQATVRRFECDDEFWEMRGAELLGLSEDEASALFYAENETAKSLMRAVADGDSAKFNEISYGPEWKGI